MSERYDKERHALLVTGIPGVGKTTVVQRVAKGLKGNEIGGFYTDEIREKGERCGFRLVSFGGPTQIVAHMNFSKTHSVGKYGVDVEAIDEAASSLRLRPGARVYLVDEIGKMECLSQRFVAAVQTLLNSDALIVATVGAHGGGLISEVKRRPECELWEVTRANRDELPDRILAWLAERTQAGPKHA